MKRYLPSKKGITKMQATIVIAIIIIAVVVGAVIWNVTRPRPPKGPLEVFEWTGFELEEFWGPFKDKYPDVEVKFSYFEDTSEALAKLKAGFRPDIVHPTYNWVEKFYEEGLLEPIDLSLIPNYEDVFDGIKELVDEFTVFDGKHYFVPIDWGATSVAYRPDLLGEMGIGEPDSWDILWDERLSGRIAVMDSMIETVPYAALVAGIPEEDIWTMSDAQLETVKQKLLEQKPLLRTYYTDWAAARDMLVSGECVALYAWEAVYAEALAEGVSVEFLEPKEGRLGWLEGFAILKDTDQRELAHEFINAWLAPVSGANLISMYGYGHANKKSPALADPEMVQLLELDTPVEKLAKSVFWQLIPEHTKYEEMWTMMKADP